MNHVLHNGADAFLARFQGLRARLPGDAAIRAALHARGYQRVHAASAITWA